MSVWEWVWEFDAAARASGDEQRIRLRQLLQEGGTVQETDPDLALARFGEGRTLAAALGEPWWVLLFDHWRLQILLHFKCDYPAALELAVQAALEARKPAFAAFPQRVCLHEDLIYCYVNTDPWGHANAIRDALAFMEAEVDEDAECRHCIESCAASFAQDLGNLDEAEARSQRGLEMAEDGDTASTHHAMSVHAKLCELAALREDWASLEGHARAGMLIGLELSRPRLMAELLLWQALLARRAGDEKKANQQVLRAAQLVGRLKAVPYDAYYNALCLFHEQGGEYDKAAAVRGRELELLAGTGLLKREVRAHIERCRYLAKIGWLGPVHRNAARAAAEKLRDPAPWLAELEKLK